MMVQVLGLLFLMHLTQGIQRALDADTTDISVVKLLTDQLRKIKMEKLQLENEKMVKEQDHRWQGNHHMKRSIPYFKEQLVPDVM